MHRICQQRAKIEFCNPAARFAAAVKAWLIAISIVIVNNLPPLFAGITILSSRERDREREWEPFCGLSPFPICRCFRFEVN